VLSARGFRHALRLLLELTRSSDRVGTRELARRADVPPFYAGKLVTALVSAGLIDARRGRSGGVKLGRLATKISLGDVVAAVGPATRHGCALGGLGCPQRPCLYHPACRRLGDALATALFEHTLADLAGPLDGVQGSPEAVTIEIRMPSIEDELL